MILTFEELGINLQEYTGMTVWAMETAIINIAADYMKYALYGATEYDSDEQFFAHYNWDINPVTRLVTIPDNALKQPYLFQ